MQPCKLFKQKWCWSVFLLPSGPLIQFDISIVLGVSNYFVIFCVIFCVFNYFVYFLCILCVFCTGVTGFGVPALVPGPVSASRRRTPPWQCRGRATPSSTSPATQGTLRCRPLRMGLLLWRAAPSCTHLCGGSSHLTGRGAHLTISNHYRSAGARFVEHDSFTGGGQAIGVANLPNNRNSSRVGASRTGPGSRSRGVMATFHCRGDGRAAVSQPRQWLGLASPVGKKTPCWCARVCEAAPAPRRGRT